MNMKLRYCLFFRRKSVYYAFDDTTKTFTSLKAEAMERLSVSFVLMEVILLICSN